MPARQRPLILLAALALLGCGEKVVDTGVACIVPEGMSCGTCDSIFDVGPGYTSTFCGARPLETKWTDECSPGTYHTSINHPVEIWLGNASRSSSIECSVEQTGERELTVHASFERRPSPDPDQDADDEPDVVASCRAPKLSAGRWTLRYGKAQTTFEVGTQDVSMACVDSGRVH